MVAGIGMGPGTGMGQGHAACGHEHGAHTKLAAGASADSQIFVEVGRLEEDSFADKSLQWLNQRCGKGTPDGRKRKGRGNRLQLATDEDQRYFGVRDGAAACLR